MSTVRIRLSGKGGQGILLSGYIIGLAAAVFENREVVFTQTYGAEMRGGFTTSALVISDGKIDYPYVDEADVLIAMAQKGYNEFGKTLKPDGILIYDSELVTEISHPGPAHGLPATHIAKEKCGRGLFANMVILGHFTAKTGIVSKGAMEAAIREAVPKGTEEMNLRAFAAGYEY